MTDYTVNDLHFLMLHAGIAHHHGDWNWKDVKSPFARLYYVTEGAAQVVMPNATLQLLPHHLYIIPPNTLHSNICTGTFSHYYVHIYEDPSCDSNIFDDFEFPFDLEALP